MSTMIQDYGSDTVSMVFHSISPRVECEDFSAWRTLVQQLREYSFFDRRGIFKRLICLGSLAGICEAFRLVDGKAVRLELFHDTLFHCRGRPFLIFQRVGNAEHMPFWAAQLMESEHVDMFHGVAERFADLRHVLNVFLGRGEPGTSTKRTQIFLPALASRCPKSIVGCKMPPVTFL